MFIAISVNAAGNSSKSTVHLNKKNVTIYVGNSTTLKVAGKSKGVTWSSSKPTIAAVGKKGKVTGKKAGTAKITAKIGKKSYKCKVKVKKAALSKQSVTLNYGKTTTIKLNGGKIKSVKSSNTSVATITKKGKITAKKVGQAKITVTSTKGKKYTCKVTVKAYLNKKNITLTTGETTAIKLKGRKIKSIQSNNISVVTTEKSGKITAKGEGKAKVTVIDVKKKKYTCKVIVKGKEEQPAPETVTYNVQFESNGGTAVESQVVKKGDKVVRPADPTRSGYDFGGWYTDAGLKNIYYFESSVNSNMTLYASWLAVNTNNNRTYSRGEWIGMLAEMVQMNLEVDESSMDYYFSDTEGTEYAIAIETAQAYGMLPAADVEDLEQDVPEFHPEQTATREFAAYTTAHAMGFGGDYSIDPTGWGDWSDIAYQPEAAIAVSFDFLHLTDNCFCPAEPISENDVASIRNGIESLNNSAKVTEGEAHDDSEYVSGIKELNEIGDYEVEKNSDGSYTVTVHNLEQSIHEGDIIVLPSNEENTSGFILKVTSVGTAAGNSAVLKGTVPELEEVYGKIDFAGNAAADISGIETPEDVECTYIPDDIAVGGAARGAHIDAGGSTAIPGKLEFTIPNTKKEFSEFLEGSVKVSIRIPEVVCKLNADLGIRDGIKVNEFTFSVEEEIKVSGELEYTLAESGYELTNSMGNTRFVEGRIELGRVPFAIGTTGLSVDLVFFYNVSAKGTASITYTIDTKQGYQYINGSSRGIFEFSHSLDFLELKGSTQAGLGMAADICAFKLMDIVGYSGEAGLGINAAFTPHVLTTDTLFCGNVTVYPYAKHGIDQETAVGKFLKTVCHYTLEFEPLKEDSNHPYKLKLHLENALIVPECTFGTGGISGKVQTEGTRLGINKARIEVYSGDNLIRRRFTNENGAYSIDNLAEGEYKVVVSATGYFKYEMNITVKKDQISYMETALMVDRSSAGTGTLYGNIVNALNGNGISGVSYALRAGWNNTTGEILQGGILEGTDYSIQIPAGNYTLQASGEGYVSNYINVAVSGTDETKADIVLKPEGMSGNEDAENMRIVLTWGETPRDLDSHLFGPMLSDAESRFHTSFVDEEYYDDYNGERELIADLDWDDTSSYGPETTTVHHFANQGTYSFYVHDYTNGYSDDSDKLSRSGARVQIYFGDECRYTYHIPADREGTIWHVFDMDAATKEIIPVNEFSYGSNMSEIAGYSLDSFMDDLDVINSGLDNKKSN